MGHEGGRGVEQTRCHWIGSAPCRERREVDLKTEVINITAVNAVTFGADMVAAQRTGQNADGLTRVLQLREGRGLVYFMELAVWQVELISGTVHLVCAFDDIGSAELFFHGITKRLPEERHKNQPVEAAPAPIM